jgi:hypothetical protein
VFLSWSSRLIGPSQCTPLGWDELLQHTVGKVAPYERINVLLFALLDQHPVQRTRFIIGYKALRESAFGWREF